MSNTVESIHRAQMCYAQNKNGCHITWMAQAVSHETGYTAKQAETFIKDAVIGALADMYDGRVALTSDE